MLYNAQLNLNKPTDKAFTAGLSDPRVGWHARFSAHGDWKICSLFPCWACMLLVRFKANVYILTEQELVPAVHPWACWLLHTKDNQHKLHCPANLLCGQTVVRRTNEWLHQYKHNQHVPH
jgi:hypothetical protein